MGFDTVGNGCGACSGFWKWFRPPHYKFFHEPCNRHDELYELGGNFLDRLKADYVLLKDMIELVLIYYKGRKLLSKFWFILLCFTYFIGVRIFGYTQFKYNTKQ